MARKKTELETPLNLSELIPEYGEQNTKCNALKKIVSDLNSKIKTAIHSEQRENEDISLGGWVCKLTVSEDSVMNEERLIEFAKKYKLPIVRRKEYIDFDKLEKLIYNGEIEKDVLVEMNSCKDKTTKETLRISKEK